MVKNITEKIAYLTDRIAVNSGKPQTFATQWKLYEKGEHTTGPVKNASSLEKRRAKMRLEPFKKELARRKGKIPLWEKDPKHQNELYLRFEQLQLKK